MINIFIIDDSMAIRNSIKKMLSNYSDIKIIGDAPNPVDAFKEFKKVGLPDLFILDIEMPKMNGLEFLNLMKQQKQIPTIICSGVVQHGSQNAIMALELGACDIISKSSLEVKNNSEISDEFISKIRAVADSKIINFNIQKNKLYKKPLKNTNKIVAIGSSTGGVQTLERILQNLRPNHSPIVIVQHMPKGFTTSFANRLNEICENSYIKEASDNDPLLPGQVLIAPGDLHLEVKHTKKDRYIAVIKNFPKVSNHKPSVDVLFSSVAKEVYENSVAIILTGMGKDGALGIKKIKDAGGTTYGQDEKTSVVYGMPKVAFEIGGVQKQVALEEVATIINDLG